MERREGAVHTAEIGRLTGLLQVHPESVGVRYRLAQLHFLQRDYDAALAELSAVERARRGDPEVLVRRAVVLMFRGDLQGAERAARRALRLRPEYPAARECLGEILLTSGRSQEALAQYDRCLRLRPTSAAAHLGRARALEQQLISRFPIAPERIAAAARKAAALDPENQGAVAFLARVTFNYLLRPDEAERLALQASRMEPSDPEPYLILAEIALHRPPTTENLAQAARWAVEGSRRAPDDWRPPYQLGRALLLSGAPAEAARMLRRSLAIKSTPEVVYQLSLAYRRAGDAAAARDYADQYSRWQAFSEKRKALLGNVQREPGRVEHYYRLAQLYLDGGSAEPALNWLEKARRIGGSGPRYRSLADRIHRMREAERTSARTSR